MNSYSEYDARLWNGPTNEAYLNRAWCRLEIIYASVIPICRLQNGHVISKSPLPGSSSSSSSSSSLSPSLSAPSGKGSRSGGSKAGGAISVKRKPAPSSPMSPPNGESTRNIHQKTLEYNDIMRKMFKGWSEYKSMPHRVFCTRNTVGSTYINEISCTVLYCRWAPVSYQPWKAAACTVWQPRNDSFTATDHHPTLAKRVFR